MNLEQAKELLSNPEVVDYLLTMEDDRVIAGVITFQDSVVKFVVEELETVH